MERKLPRRAEGQGRGMGCGVFREGVPGCRLSARMEAEMRRTRGWGVSLCVMLLSGCSPLDNHTTSMDSDSAAVARLRRESQVTMRLEETQTRLDSLRDEVGRAGSTVGAALTGRLAMLEAERDSAQQRLAELQKAGQQEWQEMQPRIATMLDSLDVRIDRLRRDLRRPT